MVTCFVSKFTTSLNWVQCTVSTLAVDFFSLGWTYNTKKDQLHCSTLTSTNTHTYDVQNVHLNIHWLLTTTVQLRLHNNNFTQFLMVDINFYFTKITQITIIHHFTIFDNLKDRKIKLILKMKCICKKLCTHICLLKSRHGQIFIFWKFTFHDRTDRESRHGICEKWVEATALGISRLQQMVDNSVVSISAWSLQWMLKERLAGMADTGKRNVIWVGVSCKNDKHDRISKTNKAYLKVTSAATVMVIQLPIWTFLDQQLISYCCSSSLSSSPSCWGDLFKNKTA